MVVVLPAPLPPSKRHGAAGFDREAQAIDGFHVAEMLFQLLDADDGAGERTWRSAAFMGVDSGETQMRGTRCGSDRLSRLDSPFQLLV